MKRIVTAALTFALAGPAFAADRRYTVTDFDRVLVEGPFEVVVKTGKAPSARATGTNAAIERLSIEVEGRTLKVRRNRSAWGGYPGKDSGPIAIELTTRDLRGASVTGSGGLAIDKAKAMRFDLALSGSGRLSIGRVEADNLVVGLVGSGRMSVGGKVKGLKATVQGSGDFDGSALMVEDAQLNADTSGTVALAASRTSNIVSSGAGDTTVTGKPACTVKAVGSGRVRCGD
ncbi:MAG TPA: head GIN domain-containing protein [Allosphingosinicella sp.]